MKKIKIYTLCAVVGTLFTFSACEKHDFIDDIASIGKQAANVYWEIPNLSTHAGDSVEFNVQYWSVNDTYKYLGVWYDIVNSYLYSAKNATFNYSLSIDTTEVGREFQEIMDFSDRHNASLWDNDLRAYVLKAKFPVSHTLTSSMVSNPLEISDVSTTLKLYPKFFEQSFKEGLYPKLLEVADSAKLMKFLTVDFPRTDTLTVRSFYESKFDENAGTDIVTMTDSGKEKVKAYLNTIPLDSLTFNSQKLVYEVEYKKNFKLGARFRVINGNDVENMSDIKTITVD